MALGSEIVRAFGATHNTKSIRARRTVADLRALAETQRALRERADGEREKKAAQADERNRQRRLAKLGRNIDSTWLKLERLVESSSYDEAVALAVDLRDLATREDGAADFAGRFEGMRKRQARRRGFFDRWRGINAFYYSHGPYVWEGLPPAGIPDSDPGVLQYQSISVRQGGNHVRSYLDVVAPDETNWTEIRQSFVAFVSESQRAPLPWVGVRGRCFFRIGMDLGLVQRWQREIADLYRAVQSVRTSS